MSQEYILSVAIVIGSLLKLFGVDIESKALEGGVLFVASLWIAIRRYRKGDISPLGVRK